MDIGYICTHCSSCGGPLEVGRERICEECEFIASLTEEEREAYFES